MSKKSKRRKTKRTRRHDGRRISTSPDVVYKSADGHVIQIQVKAPNRPAQPLRFKVGGITYQFTYESLNEKAGAYSIISFDPPKNALRIFSLFLKADEREAGIGDLVETYQRKCKEVGQRKADRWVYRQVARSLIPLIIRFSGKIGWLILGAWIKKLIS